MKTVEVPTNFFNDAGTSWLPNIVRYFLVAKHRSVASREQWTTGASPRSRFIRGAVDRTVGGSSSMNKPYIVPRSVYFLMCSHSYL